MDTNEVPHYDDTDNPTGCCPRFNPEGWDGRSLHFRDKAFLRAETKSAMHIPINMGKVFDRVGYAMENANAIDTDNCIVLSREISPWKAEHFFSTEKDVPGEEMTTLSGDYLTKVFEGSFRNAKNWHIEMQELATGQGHEPKSVMFFYTTCPKCAKTYGKNYVVGVVEI